MKLQSRILLFVVPLTVVPLLLIGWIAYSQLRETALQDAGRQVAARLEQLGQQLVAEVDKARANLDVVAGFSLLERYVVTENEEDRYTLMQPSLYRLFADFQRTYPGYYEIRILLPDGYEDARSTVGVLPDKPDAEGDNAIFAALRDSRQPYHTDFVRNPDNGELALLAARPLALVDRAIDPALAKARLRGYLVFTIRLDSVAAQVRDARIGRHGYMAVTDADGVLLMHPDNSETWKRLPASVFEQMRASSRAEEGALVVIDGVEMLVRGLKYQDDMYLFGFWPKEELTAAGRNLGKLLALVLLVTIVVTVVLLIAQLNRLLVSPIQRLSEAASEIGRGNLDVNIDIDQGGEIGALAQAFRDMGRNLGKSSEQVHYLAYHDSLTGLPNRSMFREYLLSAINDSRRSGQMLGLLFLDVDNFKHVNDTLGHQTGDELLRRIADVLDHCLRDTDTVAVATNGINDMVARLGGDEFTILLPHVRDPFAAGAIARRILERLQAPLAVGEHSLYATTSIGIAMYPADGDDADTLIKHADIAMYHAKDRGKNNYQYFSDNMNVAAYQRVTMENKLRRALEHDEFFLDFQPIVDAGTRSIVAVEALMRWREPEAGLVPPDSFIPVAEESGLIVQIGEWVLRQACLQNKAWQKAGLPPICMAVNVSNIQVNRGDLEELTAKVLRETGLEPRYLEMEITESSIMAAHEHAITTLNGLRGLGVKISLDDFGTGYSSLSYLRHFPLDNLKIDRSFVREILENEKDAAIISAIVAMGHTLGLKVIAEGIETEKQLAFLLDRGCDYAQGYLLSRPVSPARIEEMLAERKRRMA